MVNYRGMGSMIVMSSRLHSRKTGTSKENYTLWSRSHGANVCVFLTILATTMTYEHVL